LHRACLSGKGRSPPSSSCYRLLCSHTESYTLYLLSHRPYDSDILVVSGIAVIFKSMDFSWGNVALIAVAVDWLIKLGLLFYVPRNRKPNAAIAWLLVLFLLPWVGLVLFLLIGNPKLSKRRRGIQKEIDELIETAVKANHKEENKFDNDEVNRFQPIAVLTQSLGKLPMRVGNSVKILPEYDNAIEDITKEIYKSKEFVHLEYFIVALDKTTHPLFEAMKDAVKRGVKVRMLIDGMGYRRYPRRKEMQKLLNETGVEWHFMLPIRLRPSLYNRPDLRNHRKIVVIDDRIAYVGSQNLIDRAYHRKDNIYYDELVAKLAGPIVRHCSVIFAGDWYAESGDKLLDTVSPELRAIPKPSGNVAAQMLPSGPSYDTQNNAALFTFLFHTARKRIVITNPYFIPTEAMLDALLAAVSRGVEVIMINSESMDQWMVGHAQRSYYPQLINAGIQIYLYRAPILLHSKHITIDDDIAVIGSSNLDIRSFELDLECTLVVYDKSVVTDLQKVQTHDLAKSVKINLNSWNKRSNFKKMLDSIARLTAAIQ
jgi:cardiolipin synthase